MTRNKKNIFSLKEDKRYVRPNGLHVRSNLVHGLTYDRLIRKSYLQACNHLLQLLVPFLFQDNTYLRQVNVELTNQKQVHKQLFKRKSQQPPLCLSDGGLNLVVCCCFFRRYRQKMKRCRQGIKNFCYR